MIPGVGNGDVYLFAVTRAPGAPVMLIPDPYSRAFIARDMFLLSSVADSAFEWTDAEFVPDPIETLVLYQLNIHTFTPEGTWVAATARLPEIVSLGVNCIALMPHTQDIHPVCWGYDPISLTAAHCKFGTLRELKVFVNACHQHGLAVLFDWVPNHLHITNILYPVHATDEKGYFDPST